MGWTSRFHYDASSHRTTTGSMRQGGSEGRRSKMHRTKNAVLGMVVALAAWIVPAAVRGQIASAPDTGLRQPILPPPSPTVPSLDDGLLPEERVAISVYEFANRGVVHINTRSFAMDSFLKVAVREGSGSGSIIDRTGLILTNQHVIDGARDIRVSLSGGSAYPAHLVGQDPETDIAVLKIDAPPEQLHPIPWGISDSLRVGQRIYAIGNPFGLERSMSSGMISSLNRQIPSRRGRAMRALIQIDASINQGNSGGPLLNTRGELIGMTTAIMSSDGDSAGVGFAIPVSTIRRIVPRLIQDGRIVRATIGIRRVYETDNGLLIVDVVPGGPADQAGLRGFSVVTKTYRQGLYKYTQSVLDTSSADRIIAVDGQPVDSADSLLAAIEDRPPGSTVVLTIVRDNQTLRVPVTLGPSE
ncbi:MAG: PDZ domain-containing protein [Planctomycetota bacterium]|nr:MAG: PDZ domain-containing protein [Planctomycetota bacterium]